LRIILDLWRMVSDVWTITKVWFFTMENFRLWRLLPESIAAWHWFCGQSHAIAALQGGKERTGKGVHEAARIGVAATGGEILASTVTLREADVHVVRSARRTLTLKGRSNPVEVATIN
jgi:hypothetical protein